MRLNLLLLSFLFIYASCNNDEDDVSPCASPVCGDINHSLFNIAVYNPSSDITDLVLYRGERADTLFAESMTGTSLYSCWYNLPVTDGYNKVYKVTYLQDGELTEHTISAEAPFNQSVILYLFTTPRIDRYHPCMVTPE